MTKTALPLLREETEDREWTAVVVELATDDRRELSTAVEEEGATLGAEVAAAEAAAAVEFSEVGGCVGPLLCLPSLGSGAGGAASVSSPLLELCPSELPCSNPAESCPCVVDGGAGAGVVSIDEEALDIAMSGTLVGARS